MALAQYKIKSTLIDTGRTQVRRGVTDDGAPALLKIPKASGGVDPAALLQSELAILGDLVDVKAVPKKLGVGQSELGPTLALEDTGGRTLAELLDEKQLDLPQILEIAEGLTQALSEIHGAGIILKDLCPEYVLLGTDGDISIFEFGIASRLQNEQTSSLSEGSYYYMSPEQTGRLNRKVDFRSDYYSLGVIFYRLLTGRLPFTADDPLELVHAHVARTPEDPLANATDPGSIMIAFAAVLSKLMDKSPNGRYQSLVGLASDLASIKTALESGIDLRFAPGLNDIPTRFVMPDKLYGRSDALTKLSSAFEVAAAGQPRLVLIDGYSGVGKSSLVKEIHLPVAQKSGRFCEGKFDQYHSDLPYSAFTQAIDSLCFQILQSPNTVLEDWRQKLHETLGENGQIIVNLAPRLEAVIGPQPPLKDLNPTEAQNRFFLTFQKFIQAVATAETPLVLFLDDLQWADSASVELLERLLSLEEDVFLCIISAYRSNEVIPGHPLYEGISRLNETNNLVRISLAPLTEKDFKDILYDATRLTGKPAEQLATALFNKTRGNPFFLQELLKTLTQNLSLRFEQEESGWVFDLTTIDRSDVSDNVAEFMQTKIRELPEASQHCLQIAACIGAAFDFATLCILAGESYEKMQADLWPAVVHGIIFPVSKEYRFIHSGLKISEELAQSVRYQFQHDRLQQAAYSLITPEAQERAHLELARLLLKHHQATDRDERAMEIVHHLNHGRNLIAESEKTNLIKLNYLAGRRANQSNAHVQALTYLTIARENLSTEFRQQEPQLCYDLLLLYCKSAYLCGATEDADKESLILLEKAETDEARARINEMQSVHYTFLGKMNRAIIFALAGLKELGISIPANPSMLTIIGEVLKIKIKLRGTTSSDIGRRDEITDARVRLIMRLYIDFIPPAYISGNSNLFALAVLKKTRLSLEHGVCPESAPAFIGYAMLLSAMGDLKGAGEFGRLALSINERFDDAEWRPMTMTLYTLFCHVWNEPWHTLTGWFNRCINASAATGDLLYMAHACFYVNLWDPAQTLTAAEVSDQKLLKQIEATRYQESLKTAQLAHRRRDIFIYDQDDPTSLSCEHFTESEYVAHMKAANYHSGLTIFHIYKTQVCYLFGDLETALVHAKELGRLRETLLGSAFGEELTLYSFLVFAAVYPKLKGPKKWAAKRRLKKEMGFLKNWATHKPESFSHLYNLALAEYAALSGKTDKARRLYEKAVKSAQKNNFTRYVALCCERAGRYLESIGESITASFYLKSAAGAYNRWGAHAKANQILQAPANDSVLVAEANNTTDTSGEQAIDLATIVKSSQIISKEINLDNLLRLIISIVIENAGADFGALLLPIRDDWFLMAEGKASSQSRAYSVPLKIDSCNNIAKSVFYHVLRTGETVVLNNVGADYRFLSDHYIRTKHPKSILCSPIKSHGVLKGIWYVENNLTTDAFSKDRLTILDLLGAQVSISLENATVYRQIEELNASLEQKVVVRTEELQTKNRKLVDSINYAESIQAAILPTDQQLARSFPEHFVIWRPRDLVGGDFYWYKDEGDSYLIAVCDCTGHGVPGALMTMLASSTLDRIVEKSPGLTTTGILKQVNTLVKRGLNQHLATAKSNDGLDMAVCRINKTQKRLSFAGAKIHLYFSTGKDYQKIKGNRSSLGYKHTDDEFVFTEHNFKIDEGQNFLLASDGFIDQNGGDRDLSFGRSRFEKLLNEVATLPLKEQAQNLSERLADYQKNEPQRDDITVFGFKVF